MSAKHKTSNWGRVGWLVGLVVCAIAQACVTSFENGKEVSNVAAVNAGGYHLSADTTVHIDIWEPFGQSWQALTTTQTSIDPVIENENETLYSWSKSLNLNNANWWSGPGATGEVRLRFQGRLSNGNPYNLVTFEKGGTSCMFDKVINEGDTFTSGAYDCRSPLMPVVNLRKLTDLTTVYLVRHAEKAAGTNPPLTPEGHARAADLAEELAYASIDGIITSQWLRTQQTAAPLAADLGIAPVVIDAHNFAGIANYIVTNHAEGSVLVVGHSDTVDEIVAALGATMPQPGIVVDYDNLFVVHRNEATNQKTAVQRTYGEPSP